MSIWPPPLPKRRLNVADNYGHYRGDVLQQARMEYDHESPPFIQGNLIYDKGISIKAFRKSRTNARRRAWGRELTCRQWDVCGTQKFWTYTESRMRTILKAFRHSSSEVAFYEWLGGDGQAPWDQWGKAPVLYLPYSTKGFWRAFDEFKDFQQAPTKPRAHKGNERAGDSLEAAQEDKTAQESKAAHEALEEAADIVGGGKVKSDGKALTGVATRQWSSLPPVGLDDSNEELLLCSLRRQKADASCPTLVQSTPLNVPVAGAASRLPNASSPARANSLLALTSINNTSFIPAPVPGESFAAITSAHNCISPSNRVSMKDQDITDSLSLEPDSAPITSRMIQAPVSDDHPIPATLVEASASKGLSGTPMNSSVAGVPTLASIAKDGSDKSQATGISQTVLNHTTFRISLSTNAFGAVPVKLSSCPTIADFYYSIAAAWSISEFDIEAVSVQFGSLTGADSLVVKREVPDSYLELLEAIEDDDCWKGEYQGRKKCSVKVVVHMKEGSMRAKQRKRRERDEEKEDDGPTRQVIKLE
ncbi:hypothetical protein MMC30_002803 [Trapelia coarctata]|nr:hypothetical protein [Trapelia coarctata]